jgi:hypothetical protein
MGEVEYDLNDCLGIDLFLSQRLSDNMPGQLLGSRIKIHF